MSCVRELQVESYSSRQPALELRVVSSRRRSRRAQKKSALGFIEKMMFGAAVVGLLWFGASTVANIYQSDTGSVMTQKLTVHPGETLWQIAASLTPENGQLIDTINEIRSLNPALGNNSQLTSGETILVPLKNFNEDQDLHLAKAADTPSNSM